MCLATSSALLRPALISEDGRKNLRGSRTSLEIGSARLLALHRGTMTRHESAYNGFQRAASRPSASWECCRKKSPGEPRCRASRRRRALLPLRNKSSCRLCCGCGRSRRNISDARSRRAASTFVESVNRLGQGQAQAGKARVQLRHGFHHALEIRPANSFIAWLRRNRRWRRWGCRAGRNKNSPTCGRNARGCR